MGKRRGNFKITNRNKEKYVPKQKYDLSQYKDKRIIGYINKETPILGSKSELIKPLNELYELLNHLPEDADICHLAKSDWYPFQLTKQVNTYFYECSKQFFNKTTAYIISKKGAQKVLDYTKNSINVPADDLFNMIYRLTPDFKFYVPASYYFKEQDNIVSTIKDINKK